MYEKENIIKQLEDMDLGYDELNKIQIFLINKSYTPINSLVFKKESLKDKEFIFYEEDEKYLIENINNGNRRTEREYCQYGINKIDFYTFEQAKDIILNYSLWDCLRQRKAFDNIINFLIKNFEVKEIEYLESE